MMTANHIHQSNLIEDVDSAEEDVQSMEAWAYIIHKKRLTYENIMELHKLIMVNSLPAHELGHVRKVSVYVGNWVPPNPVIADYQFRNWVLDMQNWLKLDPKEMHVRFETIHPFIDGNGRTGRMLMWWHESKLGREPTLIKYRDRYAYYRWFEQKQKQPKRDTIR